jgi:hypothetical protein
MLWYFEQASSTGVMIMAEATELREGYADVGDQQLQRCWPVMTGADPSPGPPR